MKREEESLAWLIDYTFIWWFVKLCWCWCCKKKMNILNRSIEDDNVWRKKKEVLYIVIFSLLHNHCLVLIVKLKHPRDFVEEFHVFSLCSFIFPCNFINDKRDEIHTFYISERIMNFLQLNKIVPMLCIEYTYIIKDGGVQQIIYQIHPQLFFHSFMNRCARSCNILCLLFGVKIIFFQSFVFFRIHS